MLVRLEEDIDRRLNLISSVLSDPLRRRIFNEIARPNPSSTDLEQLATIVDAPSEKIAEVLNELLELGVIDSDPGHRDVRLSDSGIWLEVVLNQDALVIPTDELSNGEDGQLLHDILNSIEAQRGPVSLRQLSTSLGVWAVEAKKSLQHLIDEGLVVKDSGGYTLSSRFIQVVPVSR